MIIVTPAERGTTTSEMTASNQLIQNIRASTPTSVKHRVDDLAERLVDGLLDVVEIVRDPAQDVAPCVPIEVLERQPGELQVHVSAEPIDHPLNDTGHQVVLQPQEERAEDVKRGDDENDLAHVGKVDPGARMKVHAGQQLGQLALSASLQSGDHLRLVAPAGSFALTVPATISFVTRARIFGAATVAATLTIARKMTMLILAYSARSRPISRLNAP